MNPSKRKGTAFEVDVRDFLRANGFPNCERLPSEGSHDRGDIIGIPGWCFELKATKSIDLAGALTEAKKEANNAGVNHYAAIIKRRSHSVADAYSVMPLETLTKLLQESD